MRLEDFDKFEDLEEFLKKKAEAGSYVNPSDAQEALERLIPRGLSNDDFISYEDRAFKVGNLFWDM